MAQTFVDILDANGAHQKMDVFSVPSAQLRETTVIGSPSVDAGFCELYTADPPATAYGLPVRPLRDVVLTFHLIAAASNNATVVKNTAAKLKAIHFVNFTDSWLFLKTYNKATTPNPTSDTVKSSYPCQAGQRLDLLLADDGSGYSAGLAIAVVMDLADTGNTAVVVNAFTLDLEYK